MRAPLIAAALVTATLVPACARAQWTLQSSGTTADLRGIHAVSEQIAWASGSGGTILRTTDGGAHWQRCTTPPDAAQLDFRGIQAFDPNTAIAMSSGKGDLSRLYKTTDACQTWKLVFTNPDSDGFWDAVQFNDQTHTKDLAHRFGTLVGDPVENRFSIFFTYDSGGTWERADRRVLNHLPKAHSEESLFAASNTAALSVPDGGGLSFVTGATGGSRYLHLIPGGLELDAFFVQPSFESTLLPFKHRTSTQGAFAMSYRKLEPPDFDVMAVGGDYAHPNDSGSSAYIPAARYSWFIRHQPARSPTTPPHGYRSAVAYDAATKTWITVGPNGTDISTDDGRNWQALKPSANDAPDADQQWNALSLPFVVGPHGRIGVLETAALGAPHTQKP